jgi:hypothetical protein
MAIQGLVSTRYPIDKELSQLKEKTGDMQRDVLVKHKEIEEWTGLEKDVSPWQKLIKHWKAWMLSEHKIAIVSEPGVGYRLATVEQQFDFATRLERSGGRRFSKSLLVAGVMPKDILTDEGQRYQLAFVSDVQSIQSLRKEKRAERKSLLSATVALPRLGVEANGQHV